MASRMWRTILALCVFCLALPSGLWADTHAASSCSQADIDIAVTAATNGDTVTVPNADCTWSSLLTVTKGIRLQSLGGTITSTLSNTLRFTVTEAVCDATPFEIDGFNFVDTYDTGISNTAVIVITSTCKKFKIHDNTFSHSGSGDNSAIYITGDSYGVVYKNLFLGKGDALNINHAEWGGGTWGDGSWSDDPYLGTAKFVYFEGNTATVNAGNRTALTDISGGARVVYRYNTVLNGTFSGHGFDSDGRRRGMRLSVAYKNILEDTEAYGTCIQVRAGTGFIYENTMTGWVNDGSCLQGSTYRWGTSYTVGHRCDDEVQDYVCLDSSSACTKDADGEGTGTDTTNCTVHPHTCVGPMDNNAGTGYGSPCRDGIGRGKDIGFATAQASEPLFAWDNSGTNSGMSITADAVQNVDYYYDATGCTSGVTSGLDSAKCGTCTQGVGYWATDARKLYRCGVSNDWTEYYTEYTCPHPLTGLTGSCGSGAGTGYYNQHLRPVSGAPGSSNKAGVGTSNHWAGSN